MSKLIGVLGGMGPMASQLFYKYVTEMTNATCDQDHVRMLIYSDCEMPDRTTAILSGEYSAPYDRMLKNAKTLEACNCDAITITCNTAHYFADLIKDKLDIPIIHMISEICSEIASKFPDSKVGILATDGTIQTGLYQKQLSKCGLEPYAPENSIQKEVMHQIYDCIKSGLPYDEISWHKIENSLMKAGCDCAILACTELSVIGDENCLDDFYIDPMRVLAKKTILFSGKKLKSDYK